MGTELVLGVITTLFTTASTLGWVLDRNGKRLDSRFDSVETKFDTVIELVTEMRATMPLQYTLREDHIRLEGKVNDIQAEMMTWKQVRTNHD